MSDRVPDGLVVGIFGPTASGKSAVAETIAERVGGEIVSADAMQAYRGLPILTNQPAARTDLVAIWPLDHEGSIAEYATLAHAAVDRILASGATPIVSGGTGLYFRAAVAELELPPPPEAGARERWEEEYDRRGPDAAHALLAEIDAESAARLHPNDRRRVVRALELAESGFSLAPGHDRLWAMETRRPTLIVGLELAPEVVEQRIVERTRLMFERGVEEEVRLALSRSLSATARHVIGLEEIATLPPAEAEAAIVRRTRRYAAYQRKWLRRIPGVVRVAADRSPAEIADEILQVARTR